MVKIKLVSSNNLLLGTFKSSVIPQRDEKIICNGIECTVVKVAYDFDSEDIYAIIHVDAMAAPEERSVTAEEMENPTDEVEK